MDIIDIAEPGGEETGRIFTVGASFMGVYYLYEVREGTGRVGEIDFRHPTEGVRGILDDDAQGVVDEDLLKIVLHRLHCYQAGFTSGKHLDSAAKSLDSAVNSLRLHRLALDI